MKKLILFFLSLMLIFAFSSTTLASHFVAQGHKNIYMDRLKQFEIGEAMFPEDGTDDRYGFWCRFDGDDSIIEFNKDWKSRWKKKLPAPSFYSFSVDQIRDMDTKKYFYTITAFMNYDMTSNAYLVGYDKAQKKAFLFIDSDSFHSPENSSPTFMVKNGNLYLMFYTLGGGKSVAYKLNWDAKSNWFGYTYVGTNW